MAVTVRNIIVGAGNLYISAADNAKVPLPVFTSGVSANVTLDSDAAWRHAGATQEGVEVAYEPDYGEVEVDQLKDAAILFNQGTSISMNTNMAEASLQNLLVAWGYPVTALATDTLSLGIPREAPIERTAAVVGRAPATAAGLARERIYYARRVISVEGSNHALRRTEATVFPVSFRLLPDPTYAGSEYGTIIDRTV